MKTYTYVDNSNLFIEGQRLAAVQNGLAPNVYDAMNKRIVDPSWKIDYGKLYQFLCGSAKEIGTAKLWGSPPPSDSFWKMVEQKGFSVKTYEKAFSGKEKKVDVAIAHQITKDVYSGLIRPGEDEIYLVAGDKDFVPVIEDICSNGVHVAIVFWDHAAQELKDCASEFISLNKFLNHLQA